MGRRRLRMNTHRARNNSRSLSLSASSAEFTPALPSTIVYFGSAGCGSPRAAKRKLVSRLDGLVGQKS
jgi:hypothetical protein